MKEWYEVLNIGTIDSPALLIYKERVLQNIQTALAIVKDADRLRPHVKTHKNIETTILMLEAGITKFKCATIAEAEMLAMAKAKDVLLAYQPAGPKLERFINLIKAYPLTSFSCLTDDLAAANNISLAAIQAGIRMNIFIDKNAGMNRTGINAGNAAMQLYETCAALPGLNTLGFHVYDGHIRDVDMEARTAKSNEAFEKVVDMKEQLIAKGYQVPIIIAGGSPTYPIHAARAGVECSPGTFIFWDKTYLTLCPEQPFVPAALVVSRVISNPDENIFCTDLGHKSIASESTLDKRVYFLNAPGVILQSHSEEHLVIKTMDDQPLKIGDVLYGLPNHVCPTVALYENAFVVENGLVNAEWRIIARDRKINF